jgi:hypothetical protein
LLKFFAVLFHHLQQVLLPQLIFSAFIEVLSQGLKAAQRSAVIDACPLVQCLTAMSASVGDCVWPGFNGNFTEVIINIEYIEVCL